MSQPLKMIIGLGNPGQSYAATRHNVGVWFIDAICQQTGCRLKRESKFKAQVGKCDIDGHSVMLVVPTTYMNESGYPTKALAHFYKIEPEEILIVHDELDLPPGLIRFKFDGGHGGHNGLRDIISHLGSRRFARLRVGIGKPKHKDEGRNFVLNPPSRHESSLIQTAMDNALIELPLAVSGQLEKAMLRLHTE